tara:strand:- start:1737 stop:3071 length:1335 start_codon:yes stop_codon:yes gene_type:complete
MAFKIFINNQIKVILTGEIPAILNKFKKLFFLPYYLLIGIFAIPFVLLIRLLSPILVIRLAPLDIGRIGGTYHADLYLSEKQCGHYQEKYLDIFYFVTSTNHVNHQWKKMWKRELNILSFSALPQSIERVNKLFPEFEKFQIPNSDFMPSREEYNNYLTGKDSTVYKNYNKHLNSLLSVSKPNLSFTPKEIQLGERYLNEIGIPSEVSFICFHNRDSAFLDTVQSSFDWSYHDYRNSSLEKYLGAAEEMIGRGHYSVRIGSITKEKIHNTNRRLIDYANIEKKSDFLDIYLSSKCRFILCSDTGMSFPAEVFKRPLVYVNWTHILRLPVYALNGLIIFKKFFFKNENRFMSFSEMTSLNFFVVDTAKYFSDKGIEIIENSSQEICDVTLEMDKRLNGTWVPSPEDDYLQQCFWNLFGKDKLKSLNLRIGAMFLRQNKNLLNLKV